MSKRQAERMMRTSMPLFLYGATYQEHLEVAQKLHEHSFFASGNFVEARLTHVPRALRYQILFGFDADAQACPADMAADMNEFEAALLLKAQGGTLFIDEIDALTAEMQIHLLKIIHQGIQEEGVQEEGVEEGAQEEASFRIIFASQYSLSLLVRMKCLIPDFIEWLMGLNGRQSLGRERVLAIKNMSVGGKQRSLLGLGRALEPILQDYVQKGLQTQSADLYATVIEEIERPLIRMALCYTGGNQLKTASLLGLNRNTLRKRIKELHIDIPQKGERM